MDPLPNNAIVYFRHPGHPLELLEVNTEYVCDGCKTNGSGTTYRCNSCDFDLHEYCGTCPGTLSSFMHLYPPSLVVHNAQATSQNEPVCDVCGDHVEGMFYRCENCEFNLHPLCTLLPQSLRHVLHLEHELTFQADASPDLCAICRGSCCSWRYRCGACGFDIHKECILVPCDPPTQRSVPFSQPGPPPQCPIPPFGPSGSPPYGGSGHGMPSGYGPPGPPPYGGCGPPPYSGYGQGMLSGHGPPGPPPYGGCGHEMPFRHTPPGPPPYGCYGHEMPFRYSPPRAPPFSGFGHSPPSGYSPYNNGNHQTPTVGRTTNGKKCKMFRLVRQLGIGLASNAIFGLIL
ncbi:unnamed protein product [Ilex paraguariensis]|uniref:DC1 domain-containing protein n=1 Tax=Ilex paraguariensis TaxID=185542 RepID=A0ABC8UWD7_9AQUA